MPKKSNDEFRNMSVKGILEYTDEHPKEGGRTSTILGKAAAECLGIYIENKVESAKRILTPPQLENEK